jgi:hypothetical protein|tara:strand:+ start:2589 stop:2798 length:210 start_codon:yes stop_codon:yes gene_type:complete
MSKAQKGRKITWGDKIFIANKKVYNDPKKREEIRKREADKKHSEETRRKISLVKKGNIPAWTEKKWHQE